MIDLLMAFIGLLEVSCRYCVGLDGKQGLSSGSDHSCFFMLIDGFMHFLLYKTLWRLHDRLVRDRLHEYES